MDEAVLLANERGHTAADVERASGLIQAAGLNLGLQMMTGLYKSDEQTDEATARRLADLRPDTMRIYPTVVMEHTRLAQRYRQGEYSPPSLAKSVSLCARLLRFFEQERGIPVIRLGLHAGRELEAGMVAGPWHPAFRELCESENYLAEALGLLKTKLPEGGTVTLAVASRAVSKMIGQKRQNIERLYKAGYTVTVRGDDSIADSQVEWLARTTP
jgi:histone acetyltransferase (RNA polymerase elongator complex component)